MFRICLAENCLRVLMAQAALSLSGPRGLKKWAEQIEDATGFTGQLMDQLASSFARQSWVDPLISNERTSKRDFWERVTWRNGRCLDSRPERIARSTTRTKKTHTGGLLLSWSSRCGMILGEHYATVLESGHSIARRFI